MSVDVTIRQKGFFKKDLPLEVILGNNLSYGTFDGLRLETGVMKGGEFIAYNNAHIGRGFSVTYDKANPNEIALRLLNPTSNEELHDFYQCVGRIVNRWKCELGVDGETVEPSDFQRGLSRMREFNANALRKMAEDICNGESGNLTLFSAFWPLVIGKMEAELFKEGGVDAFRDWMHKKQSIDAYYAKPRFFMVDHTVVGRYVITENTLSIFPLKGRVPFGAVNSKTNEPLTCENYEMCFYSTTRNAGIGEIPYEQFFSYVDGKKIRRYDADHVVVKPISLAEMEEIVGLSAKKDERVKI